MKSWLATLRSVPWIVALGVLLASTSLGVGLVFDDYLFEIVLRRLPMVVAQTGPLDLFRFADGDPKTARGLMDIGQILWTADPATRGAFLRPLSALTHILDYALWPRFPALMHAQNLFWFAATLAAAALVYRRFIRTAWVAGLATLMYAVDDTHGQAVAWIANRNVWVAATLGLPVLWVHDRWRRDGWRPGAWLGPALLASALLAGESAVAVVGYVAAHALHLERGSWRARVVALAPYVGVTILWRAAYSHYGFGVSGSSIYIDPGRNPGLFLAALPRRVPFLLVGAFAIPRPDFAELYALVTPELLPTMLVFCVLVLAALALAVQRIWRTDPSARFFSTGLVLSVVPISATAPGDRLLVFTTLGTLGLVSLLIGAAVSRYERIAAWSQGIIHLAIAPPLLAIKSSSVIFEVPLAIAEAAVPKAPDIAGKTVLFLNPPLDGFGSMLIATRIVRGEPRPAFVRTLAGLDRAIDVTRVDERSLLIRPTDGFLKNPIERGWRTPDHPLLAGDVVEMTGLTVTVTASTADQRPAEALFRFDRPLEDPSFLWLRWNHGTFAEWSPPPIGESIHLPGYGFREAVQNFSRKTTTP